MDQNEPEAEPEPDADEDMLLGGLHQMGEGDDQEEERHQGHSRASYNAQLGVKRVAEDRKANLKTVVAQVGYRRFRNVKVGNRLINMKMAYLFSDKKVLMGLRGAGGG